MVGTGVATENVGGLGAGVGTGVVGGVPVGTDVGESEVDNSES